MIIWINDEWLLKTYYTTKFEITPIPKTFITPKSSRNSVQNKFIVLPLKFSTTITKPFCLKQNNTMKTTTVEITSKHN